MSNELLTLKNLKQYFPVGKDRFVRAVDGVDLTINHGDVMGLVGESGSGKSTIAYTVMGMYGMTGGEIDFEGEVFTKETKRKRSMKFRREAQIVFQDPGSSLNPYQDVRSILSLPLKVHKVVPKNEIDDKILEILEMVELPADFMYKSPNSIGGGEKQLVSIARALCCNPKFIILDEPTSSLDVSIQRGGNSVPGQCADGLQFSHPLPLQMRAVHKRRPGDAGGGARAYGPLSFDR